MGPVSLAKDVDKMQENGSFQAIEFPYDEFNDDPFGIGQKAYY